MIQTKQRFGRFQCLRFWLWAIVWCAFNLPTHAQTTGTGTDQNRPGTANKGKARTEENLNLETDPAELYVALKGTNGTNTALQELRVRVTDTISGTVPVSLGSIPAGRVTFWTGCNDSTATQVTSLDVGTSWVSVWLRGETVSTNRHVDKIKLRDKEVPLNVLRVDINIDLLDNEPDADPRTTIRDASGVDLTTLSVTLNGNTVPTGIMVVTDIFSGSTAIGKKLQFVVPSAMVNLPGNNEMKTNVNDVAGNPMNEITQVFVLP